jgi:hypothetical protein
VNAYTNVGGSKDGEGEEWLPALISRS